MGFIFIFLVCGVQILAQIVLSERLRFPKRALQLGFRGHGVLLKSLPEERSIFVRDLEAPGWGWGKGSSLAKFIGDLRTPFIPGALTVLLAILPLTHFSWLPQRRFSTEQDRPGEAGRGN